MSEQQSRRVNSLTVVLVGVVVVLVFAVGWLVLAPQEELTPRPAMIEVAPIQPIARDASPKPAPLSTPVTTQEETAEEEVVPAPMDPPGPPLPALPSLNESDTAVMDIASDLDPLQKLSALLIPDRVLLKFVRAVIALDEGNVVKDYRPLESPAPPMKVIAIDEPLNIEIGQRYRIDPANYGRYNAYVDALVAVDKERVAALYHHYYPLLDEAYQQYGVDRGGFLNVTLRAIDAVNAVKINDFNAVLIQPKVFYEFQDPQLQAKPGPYKLLFRLGPDHSAKVQAALRELRAALVKPR